LASTLAAPNSDLNEGQFQEDADQFDFESLCKKTSKLKIPAADISAAGNPLKSKRYD
jgi:hypothetical protein